MISSLSNQLFKKYTVFILGIILLTSIAGPINGYAENISFTTEADLSNNANNSVAPQIESLGDDIYVVWRDGNDIFFVTSDDVGENFSSSQDIGNTGTSITFGNPQLAASANNVYVIWDDNNNIKFIESSDNGITFANAEIQLSSETFVNNPQIDTPGGSTVYTSWVDRFSGDDDIVFKRSTNAGSSFDGSLKLGETDVSSIAPSMSSAGSNIYVTWQNSTDILFSSSSNFGASFTPHISLGGSSESNLSVPQLATSSSGNDVYVVWQNQSDIVISHSSDSGATFSIPLDIGDTEFSSSKARPQVETNNLGSEVYVIWQDATVGNGDIFFSKSTNSGASFTPPSNPNNGNISNNDGQSFGPKLKVSGSNIHILWEDTTPSADGSILYRLSTDGGDTFGGFSIVSNNFPQSSTASFSAIESTPFVVWQDNDSENVLFRTGTISLIDTLFDKTQYKISDTASITIIDSGSAGNIVATVKSDTDTSGVQIVLSEGDPGIFTGTVGFTEDGPSSGDILQVSHSDAVTVNFSDSEAAATIFSRAIEFDGPLNPPNFDLGEIVHVKVTDNNANFDPIQIDTVFVIVTSNTDPEGTYLILDETGIDTGIFGGVGLSDLVFSLDVNTLDLFQTMTISQFRTAGNVDANSPDTISVKVTTTSDPVGITRDLIETGNNTAVFEAIIQPVFFPDLDSQIKAQGGDFLTVAIGNPSLKSHTLITPNNNPSNGIIPVSVTATDGDEVVVTYKQVSMTANMLDVHAPGGGGGGLVRPSLVVNALLDLTGGGSAYGSPTLDLSKIVELGHIDVPLEIEEMILNHDSNTPISPMALDLFDNFEYPLIINEQGFVLPGFSTTLETQTLQTNTPHTIKFLFYESGILQHFSLYTNLRNSNTEIHQSDTQILYNNGREIQVLDPNGIFEDVSLTLNEIDDIKKEIVLEIIFANPMDTTDIIVRSWDENLNSFDTYILDAIEVVSEIEEPSILTHEEPIIENLESQGIPVWIKNNAAWWADQQIGDSDFVSGIEYLIKNGIINVPGVEVSTSSGSTEIPDWIKNNAGWWADSLITDADFIEAMQWLIGNGVIQI